MRKIAIVLYDDLTEQECAIHKNLLDYTKFNLKNHYKKLFYTKEISKTLEELSNDYDWAVVACIGTWTDLGKNLPELAVEYAVEANSPLSCHIIDENHNYFSLHPQWFAIDLKVYKELGFPKLEDDKKENYITIASTIRSLENVHNDYTPLWLEADNLNLITTLKVSKKCFGVELIANLIAKGHKIINVPDSIRQHKIYLYPKKNIAELSKMIAKKLYKPNDLNLQFFHSKIMHDLKLLIYGFYVHNTERTKLHSKLDGKFDFYAGVCSGFKTVFILNNLDFCDNGTVVLFDNSYAAIDWQKYLIANWDGNLSTFEEILSKFKLEFPKYHEIKPKESNKDLVNTLNELNITPEEFKIKWKNYRNLNHEFLKIDLLSDNAASTLQDLIYKNSKHKRYIWISNVFHMTHLSFFYTDEYGQKKLESFKDKLFSKKDSSIVLEANGNIILPS